MAEAQYVKYVEKVRARIRGMDVVVDVIERCGGEISESTTIYRADIIYIGWAEKWSDTRGRGKLTIYYTTGNESYVTGWDDIEITILDRYEGEG